MLDVDIELLVHLKRTIPSRGDVSSACYGAQEVFAVERLPMVVFNDRKVSFS
jgi:hypothetical protein